MDVATIRRKNLDYLIRQEKNASTFATKIDMSQSQLSQLRSASNPKQIGNSIARSIEEKLGFVKGWMDQLHEETLTPEDIAEISMINAGFKVIKHPKGAIALDIHRWSKPDFIVTRDNDDLQVFVDIYSKLRFGVPMSTDNIKGFVYISNTNAHKAGQILTDHFKKWGSGIEETHVENSQLMTEDENELLRVYRSQTTLHKKTILNVIKAMCDQKV